MKKSNHHEVELSNGTVMRFENNMLHWSEQAAVVHSNGTREWWFEGVRHRVDGPAIYNVRNMSMTVNILDGNILESDNTHLDKLTHTYNLLQQASIDDLDINEQFTVEKENCSYFYERGMLTSITHKDGTKDIYRFGVKVSSNN